MGKHEFIENLRQLSQFFSSYIRILYNLTFPNNKDENESPRYLIDKLVASKKISKTIGEKFKKCSVDYEYILINYAIGIKTKVSKEEFLNFNKVNNTLEKMVDKLNVDPKKFVK